MSIAPTTSRRNLWERRYQEQEARRIAKDNGYELALKASEGGEHADIYVKQKGKRTSLMIVGKEDDGETGVVSLTAKISADDLARLIKEN